MDTCLNELNLNNEKIEKNIGFLGENGQVFKLVQIINSSLQSDSDQRGQAISEIKLMIEKYQSLDGDVQEISHLKTIQFNIGVSLSIVLEFVKRNQILKQNESINIYSLY